MGISNLYKTAANGVSKVGNSISHLLDSAPIIYNAPVQPVPKVPQIDTKKFLNAIASNETSIVPGNKYASLQPSGVSKLGNALGKYRVTEGELKTYGKKYLGQNITPQQFLASTTAQDNYMINKANTLASQGYTPQDIADIHNKGITNSFPAGSGKYQNPDYVSKFNLIYNK